MWQGFSVDWTGWPILDNLDCISFGILSETSRIKWLKRRVFRHSRDFVHFYGKISERSWPLRKKVQIPRLDKRIGPFGSYTSVNPPPPSRNHHPDHIKLKVRCLIRGVLCKKFWFLNIVHKIWILKIYFFFVNGMQSNFTGAWGQNPAPTPTPTPWGSWHFW